MANLDRPKGLEPYGVAKHQGKYESGSEVFPGDAVVLASDGQVDSATAGDGVQLLGVAVNYAAAAGAELMVYDDPNSEFVIQADETELDAQTDIGNTANIVATAGNSSYKHSRMELDSSDIGTVATAQLKIMRIEANAKNALGAQAEAVVRINQHENVDGSAV